MQDLEDKNIEKTFNRLEELQSLINSKKSAALIEIDGGVNENNFERLKTLGADILVAGSYVFNSSDYNAAIDFLK
jgi:ribulose-phosphate 3-epimerase